MLITRRYQYPSGALQSMTPPAVLARESTLPKELFCSSLALCGIPYMASTLPTPWCHFLRRSRAVQVSLDKARAWICPYNLPNVLDYVIANAGGRVKAIDRRYILFVTSIRSILIR